VKEFPSGFLVGVGFGAKLGLLLVGILKPKEGFELILAVFSEGLLNASFL